MRRNGFETPLHPLQVGSWAFIAMLIIFVYGCLIPLLPSSSPPGVQWAVGTIFGALLGLLVVIYILSTVINPADQAIYRKRLEEGEEHGEFDRSKHAHVIENQYCHICKSDVEEGSKHCRACDKCVKDFDHHCRWLNNCIGSRNYRLFFMTISLGFILCIGVTGMGLYALVGYLVDNDSIEPLEIFGQEICQGVFISLTVVFLMITGFAVVLIGHLLGFHIYLFMIGMSTYQYIYSDYTEQADNECASDGESNIAGRSRSSSSEEEERDSRSSKEYIVSDAASIHSVLLSASGVGLDIIEDENVDGKENYKRPRRNQVVSSSSSAS
eukprot:Nk52_evm3s1569 gene=Nk52_evmTU3s1569